MLVEHGASNPAMVKTINGPPNAAPSSSGSSSRYESPILAAYCFGHAKVVQWLQSIAVVSGSLYAICLVWRELSNRVGRCAVERRI